MKRKVSIALFGIFLLLPIAAFADPLIIPVPTNLHLVDEGYIDPITGQFIVVQKGVLTNIFDSLFVILMIVAAIFLVIAGYQFVTASGEPEKIQQARRSVLYSLIGAGLAMLSKVLLVLIHGILTGRLVPPPSHS